MAIVKFISDESCQILIDMELVGEVNANSILKVKLDAGSYLVEIKDNNHNYLKRYELKISPEESQVLQNLTIFNNSITETIDRLRNDSSLRFYNQRAVFSHNGRYGYINSQYKVVIEPNYSFADNFILGYALVKRVFPDGEKATIIDVDGNIKYERWFDFIGGNESAILLKNEKTFYVISRSNFSIIKEYLDANFDGKGELIPVHQHIGVDDMYGFIDKEGTEIIPLIYDYVRNFASNKMATVKRFGEYNLVDTSGNLYRYGMHSCKCDILSKEESLYRGFSCYGCYPIKDNRGWGITGDSKERWERILYFWHGNRLIYRNNGICTFHGEVTFSINADVIIPVFSWVLRPTSEYKELTYFVVKKKWKYGIVNLEKNFILPLEYDMIEPTDAYEGEDQTYSSGLAIVWKNNKCSLVRIETGEFIFPFEFEDIEVNEYYDNYLNPMEDCTFMMKKNGKYGLIAKDFKTLILPFEYDSIKEEFVCKMGNEGYYSCKRIILCKNNNFGVSQKYRYRNKETEWQLREYDYRLDEKYDECIFLGDERNKVNMLDVAVRLRNKWAVAKCEVGKENGNIYNLSFDFDSFEELKKSHKKAKNYHMRVPPVSKSKNIKF